VPHRSASVHIGDRGCQFADSVYEVLATVGGHLVDEAPHLVRLARSRSELRIAPPMSDAALKTVIRRNGVRDGIVDPQITRGIAPRDHAFRRSVKSWS